jgi:hypothetical protein
VRNRAQSVCTDMCLMSDGRGLNSKRAQPERAAYYGCHVDLLGSGWNVWATPSRLATARQTSVLGYHVP